MDDFLELGIEAADVVVDKHFHRLPDSALHRDTYHPRHIVDKIQGRRRAQSVHNNETVPNHPVDTDDSDEEDLYRQRVDPHNSHNSIEAWRRDSRSASVQDAFEEPRSFVAEQPRREVDPRDGQFQRRKKYSRSPPPMSRRYSRSDTMLSSRIPPLQHESGSPTVPDSPSYHLSRSPIVTDSPSNQVARPRTVTDPPMYIEHRIERRTTRENLPPRDRQYADRRRYTRDGDPRFSRNAVRSPESPKEEKKSGASTLGGSALGAVLGGWAAKELASNSRQDKTETVGFAMLGAVAGALAGKSMGERITEDKRSPRSVDGRRRRRDSYSR